MSDEENTGTIRGMEPEERTDAYLGILDGKGVSKVVGDYRERHDEINIEKTLEEIYAQAELSQAETEKLARVYRELSRGATEEERQDNEQYKQEIRQHIATAYNKAMLNSKGGKPRLDPKVQAWEKLFMIQE